jgi:hypothetical protein
MFRNSWLVASFADGVGKAKDAGRGAQCYTHYHEGHEESCYRHYFVHFVVHDFKSKPLSLSDDVGQKVWPYETSYFGSYLCTKIDAVFIKP